jgi:ferritin
MPGKPIPAAVLTEIQRQINDELGAAHAYLALAIWCEEENYKGFAAFFKKQAGEEREHADKLMEHLLDRSALPKLGALPAPKGSFESLAEVARQAQTMEQSNTAGIHLGYEAAVTAKDYPAQVLLQWFIAEQVEEEAWTDEMIDRIARANCAGGLAELDRHIERYLSPAA